MLSGEEIRPTIPDGYLTVARQWHADDRLEPRSDRSVRRIYAYPRVRVAAGKVALARGPLVYGLEAADQAASSIFLPRTGRIVAMSFETELLGGFVPP